MIPKELETLYPFQSHTLDRHGSLYHYLDEGAGEPILMVHGNPTWSFYYRRLAQDLRDRYRVIVPDHMGCGLSGRPGDDKYDYSLERRVEDLEALLDHLEIEEGLTLVVHDWGGMIGMAVAARKPERIKRLVILNTGAFPLPKTKPFPWQLALCRMKGVGAFLVRGLNLFCRGTLILGSRRALPADVRRGYLWPYGSWESRRAVLRFVEDIPIRDRDRGFDMVQGVESSLRHFRNLPTIVFWGRKDFVFDDHFLAEWRRHLPEADVHVFEDAGHLVLEDAYERILPALKEFLQR